MHFDQFATDYKQLLDKNVALSGEGSEYFAEYKARYLARRLSPNFNGKVLDFGCGVGLLSRSLKKHLPATKLDGYDVSCASLSCIERELTSEGTFTSDFARLRNDYDLIVVANVLHHVPVAERKTTIHALADRLAAGGQFAVFEHNPVNPATRWAVGQCAFDKDAVLLPMREAVAYLETAKVRIARRDYIVFMPRALAWFRKFEPWLAPVPLGAQYVLLGEKCG
jgi:2-polyprenyl-3-methyl-5-hydroxy-6-metoxy-1,4-benzoquinol methylase